jgi:hypothetical protein
VINPNARPFSDSSKPQAELVAKMRKEDGINCSIFEIKNGTGTTTEGSSAPIHNYILTAQEEKLAKLPNTVQAKMVESFMNLYFNLLGDKQPTSGEIHLDPIAKKEIWQEYCKYYVAVSEEQLLGYQAFVSLWDELYDEVRIREYKAVPGKCNCCHKLTLLRSSTKHPAEMREISEFHVLHRISFMAERMKYYDRAKDAETYPSRYMSLIIDGMSQNHTKLPWLGNQKDFPEPLDQHLQGILEHGQGFTMYRTFNNLANDANLNIHCLLMHLESRIKRFGCLPPTIYIQVDGGSENANKYMLAICELLVSRRLTKEIFFTRLPVGHTHEDIDAKFGMLWKKLRTSHVLTPQGYAEKLKEVYSNMSFELHDIYMVANYKEFLESAINPIIAKWTREEFTQHCYKFEAVDRNEDFPLRVKTTYRTYNSDYVYEIAPAPQGFETLTGYAAFRVHSFWGPSYTKENGTIVEGMSVLTQIPQTPLVVAPFQDNFIEDLQKTLRAVRKQYTTTSTSEEKVAELWEEFAALYPLIQDSGEYLLQKKISLHIPLIGTTLFSYFFDKNNAPLPSYDSSLVHDPQNLQRDAEANPNIINVLGAHCMTFHKRYAPVIQPRVPYPPGTSTFERMSLEELEDDGLLRLESSKLKSLNKDKLQRICEMCGLSTEGQIKDLVSR